MTCTMKVWSTQRTVSDSLRVASAVFVVVVLSQVVVAVFVVAFALELGFGVAAAVPVVF